MSFVYFNKGRVGQSLLYTRPLHVWSSTWMYAWEYGLDEGVHGDQSFLLHAPASRFHIDWQASVYLPSKRVWRVCDVRSVCVTNKNCSHKSVSTTSTSILHIPIHKFALRSAHKIFFCCFVVFILIRIVKFFISTFRYHRSILPVRGECVSDFRREKSVAAYILL